MVVSPCTTFTLPEKVASFFLSRISSDAASIWIGWSRFCEKPCIAFGTPGPALRMGFAGRDQRQCKRCRGEDAAERELHHQIISRWRTCRRRIASCGGRWGNGRRRRFFGSSEMIQIHHDVAFEPHHLATVENPEPVGGQRSVQQFDVDMFVRRHRSLVDVDIGLRKSRLIARGGLQEDILSQVEQLRLAVEITGAGIHRHACSCLPSSPWRAAQ